MRTYCLLRVAVCTLAFAPHAAAQTLSPFTAEDMLKVAISPELFPQPQTDVWLRLEPARIRWMDRDTGTAIQTGVEELATETAVVIT